MQVAELTQPADRRTGIDLESSVQYAKGVGPYRAELLSKLGIRRCADLLDYLPRDYVQFMGRLKINALQSGQLAAVEGEIVQTRMIRRKPRRFEAHLEDDTGRCVLTWFNRMDVAEKIAPGVRIYAHGKVDFYKDRPQMVQPRFELLENNPREISAARLQPVYSVTADLASPVLAKIIRENLPVLLPYVAEWFEVDYLSQRHLLSRGRAYYLIHQPVTHEDAMLARRSLAYHDFFLNQAAVQIKRYHHRQLHSAAELRTDDTVDSRIRKLLDFSLTSGQNRVVALLRKQLAQTTPLNMLLQGDVGSGKTVVALYAMLIAVASGAQAALLAPTELLAEQHFTTLQRYLSASRVKFTLLTSSVSGAAKNSARAGLADGSIGIVIGTHALLREDVNFKNLALLVVDEQHKFGVGQRAAIRNRYAAVHTMVMTATPIPRTLALTVFGDLDRAIIDELPPGRRPVLTRAVNIARRAEVYEFVHKQLSKGRQAYVVLPAIDENLQDLQNAKQVFEELRGGAFGDFHVGLVHGRLETQQRRRVMQQFRAGKINLLVSTTVIEVGVDVPNASVMVVEHAERFGLAQLHQLRGRVGRGANKSYCILIAAESTEVSTARLAALVKHSSGFKIAEEDLKIRGMGEMVGTRQSGLSELQFPDLLFDPVLLPMARRDAQKLIAGDPHLIKSEHAAIRRFIAEKYSATLALADTA